MHGGREVEMRPNTLQGRAGAWAVSTQVLLDLAGCCQGRDGGRCGRGWEGDRVMAKEKVRQMTGHC